MGCVPSNGPIRPAWMSDEQWRQALKLEKEMLHSMQSRYVSSMKPYVTLGLLGVVMLIIAIACLLTGMMFAG